MLRKLVYGLHLTIFMMIPLQAVGNPSPWPYPQDIPSSSSVSLGLAGEVPADITRFLLSRGVSYGSVNRSGDYVAFLSSVTGNRQLWVMPLKGNEQPKQVTFGNGVSFYQWHPDGKHILYGADNNGDEKEAYYLINRNGTQETLLLPHSDAYRVFGQFSEEGNLFTFASTERNGRDFDIYVHHMDSGSSQRVFEAEFGFYPQVWRPGTAEVVVSQVRGEDAQNVYLLNTHNGKMTSLFTPEIAAAFTDFSWDSEGENLYFVSNVNREMMAAYQYNLASQKLTILQESQFDIANLTFCNQGNTQLWTENQQGFDVLWVKHSNMPSKQVKLPKGVYSLSCAKDAATFTVQLYGPSTPGQLYRVDSNSLQVTLLRDHNLAGLNKDTLITPTPISFPARDGVTLYGQLYLPPNSHKAPLVVDVHGGPTAQARPTWQPLTQYLLGKGIAVLDINVRGSTGYGKSFARLDNKEKRLDSVRDLVDALTYLSDNTKVDTTNAAVMGGSYGGYMVNAVMGLYPDRFKAGASFVGVSDWVRALKSASPGLKASDLIEYGDIREPKWQTFYANNSPINTVHKIQSPMFYEHGVNDPRDPVSESDAMVKILREKNIPVTYLRFEDEGHSVSKLANRVIFYRALAEFLEQHLTQQTK